VAALDTHLRAHSAGDRVDDVLDELARIRLEAGMPPLAAPIGQVLASQALLHVLSASRWGAVVDELRALFAGRYGKTPGPLDRSVLRAVELTGGDAAEERPVALADLREDAAGLAASEEELLLLALFGADAEPLLQAIRGRAARDAGLAAGGVDRTKAERIREVVRIVQESGIGEVTIEDDDMRVTVRRTEERTHAEAGSTSAPLAAAEPAPAPPPPQPGGLLRVESPMVGTFYRAPNPGAAPFVEEGDAVGPGQTLCILEAMKLMNEVKAEVEGVVRSIHVDNAQPVEFGQLLFELEPLNGRPLDAV
jgi:oxaloacetate decarboxylase alpha subunit